MGGTSSFMILKDVKEFFTAVDKSDSKEDFKKNLTDHFEKRALILNDGSMTRLLSNFIIEPSIMISKDLRSEEVTENAVYTMLNLFTAHYVQAFTLLARIYKIQPSIAFDIMSSNGNPIQDVIGYAIGKANADEHTDYLGDLLDDSQTILGSEAGDNDSSSLIRKGNASKGDAKFDKSGNRINDDIGGGMINRIVKITIDWESEGDGTSSKGVFELEVNFKLNIMYLNQTQMMAIFRNKGENKGFLARVQDRKAGLISWGELLLAGDLVAEYRKDRLRDKDDVNTFLGNKALIANAKILRNDMVGFAKHYNMLLVTPYIMEEIEKHTRGPIDRPKYKELMMQNAKAIFIGKLDTDNERFELWTKDISGSSDISFKALDKIKLDNKDSTTAMTDILKSLTNNRPPVL